MTRKKVKLAFITNDSARKATFKKRKKGLMKKVNELSTLCGIDACAIIYSPYEAQPEVWPNSIGVQRVIAQFKRMPEMEQSKKMVNQESFIRQRITKANEQLKKQIKENQEKEMTEVMYQCLTGKGSIANLTLPDLNDLGGLVDQTLKDICRRIESLNKGVPGSAVTALLPSQPPRPQTTVAGNSSTATNEMVKKGAVRHPSEKRLMVDNASSLDMMQKTQWFADWINNPSEHTIDLGPGVELLRACIEQYIAVKRPEETLYTPEQITKIFELCGSPDEIIWPGVSRLPLYNKFKSPRPMKRRVREVFRQLSTLHAYYKSVLVFSCNWLIILTTIFLHRFDRHALELLEKMLTLDPLQRISAKDALDADYFWADPFPCDPKSLPKYESSHEFQTKNKRKQQRENEEKAKKQKTQHPQQHARLPPVQHSGQGQSQHWGGHNNYPMGNTGQAPLAAGGPSHHQYGKPRGPPGGPNRYPPGGNPNPSGYYQDRSTGQGGAGFNSGPYPPHARGPSASGPRGSSAGYGPGPQNYPQQYGAGGRGPNVPGNRNQQYNWPQQ
ncbi:transcription factor, MADS-box [Artemisia annua]|uniref:Transcription factor, MADS-box n=1 Tax=Artemisia annua TaxID=35608 RepID=A0A2U1PJ37_ARTAN|nr:transcription factor, MADS-box [Artemisia annua]